MTNQTSEQFFSFMKGVINPEVFTGMFKNGMDFGNLNGIAKKNMDLFSEAQQVGMQNAQHIAKKIGEETNNRVNEFFNAFKQATVAQDLEQACSATKGYMKTTFENSIIATKDILDHTTEMTTNIMTKIGDHATEQVTKHFKF
jgi:hypothetical protein